jgi:hypothetical protein
MIKGVPYDAEVEYLESTGTQWIDTGYVLSASDRIVVQAYFQANDSSGSRTLLGVGDPKLWITTVLCRFNGENSAAINTLRELEAWNSISVDKDYCTCNGTTVPMSRGTFQNNSLSLWLFGANGSTATKTNGRIASCKIYHSGVLVRDFIPVRKGTVGYMYDRVSKKLFGNLGTGDFVLGPDKAVPVISLHSYVSESGGTALGKMGCTGLLHHITAKDYVQDGLVAMWDGIENVGYGKHQSNPAKWMDLTGNGYDFTAITGTTLDFGADHYSADGSKYLTATLDKEVLEDIQHIEVVLHMGCLDSTAVYETLMCLNSSGFRIAAPTTSPEVMNRGFSFYPGAASSVYSNDHNITTVSYAFNVGQGVRPYDVKQTWMSGSILGTYTSSVGFTNPSTGLIPKSYRDKNFNGEIYRVALYSRELTASEIAANYTVDKKRFNLPQ